MRVGIISPGDMGSAVGHILAQSGAEPWTNLQDRSQLTRTRAQEAGIRDAGRLTDLVDRVDIILSIVDPALAIPVAREVAQAMKKADTRPAFADCNATSPMTAQQAAAIIEEAGAVFIDAGIIGGPPREPNRGPRFYCSGPDTSPLESLARFGLIVRPLEGEVGRASTLKMVYGASTKGTTAVWTQLLVAAQGLGVGDALTAELANSRIAGEVMSGIPSMPRRARRWVGEMQEIAATFAAAGLTPSIFEGAAELYRFVGDSPLGALTERDAQPSLQDMLDRLVHDLNPDFTN